MLQADMADSSFAACYDAVQRVIGGRGIDAQDGTRACRYGDLTFMRTNTGTVQLLVKGHVGLSVPLLGSSEPRVWSPGHWISEVDRIDQEIVPGPEVASDPSKRRPFGAV